MYQERKSKNITKAGLSYIEVYPWQDQLFHH